MEEIFNSNDPKGDEKEIQRALDRTLSKRKVKVKANLKDIVTIGVYILLLIGLAIFQYLLNLGFLDMFLEVFHFKPKITQGILDAASKTAQAATSILMVLTIAGIIRVVFINGVDENATRFNLNRVLNLMVGMIMAFILLSILFANWYAAVYSLGLISLILGFALQTPITSFIAWIFIVATRPFKVGDRIKIGDATGDVIDIGYLTTTLWESYGDLLSTDHPSGRVINIPNSSVLSNTTYNYSWPLFPYIWDEVKIFVDFKSDLEFIASSMKRITEDVLGHAIEDKVKKYHEILRNTPLDYDQVMDKPTVSFRVNENTWIEARVHYLVSPQDAGAVKTNVIKRLVFELNKEGEKVMMPSGDTR
ncbi:MAG TPA: mechanosensitive ion channel family protein [Cytophagaceae bacterium]|jgi:small-conductance mechanosensitive channel